MVYNSQVYQFMYEHVHVSSLYKQICVMSNM